MHYMWPDKSPLAENAFHGDRCTVAAAQKVYSNSEKDS